MKGIGTMLKVLELCERYWNYVTGIGTMLKVLELCERYWNYVKGIGTMLKVLTIPKITLLQLILQMVEKNISTTNVLVGLQRL